MTEVLLLEDLIKFVSDNTNENAHTENVVILSILSNDPVLQIRALNIWAFMRSGRYRLGGEKERLRLMEQEEQMLHDREDVASKSKEVIRRNLGDEVADKLVKSL
jgi:hypothetical protein